MGKTLLITCLVVGVVEINSGGLISAADVGGTNSCLRDVRYSVMIGKYYLFGDMPRWLKDIHATSGLSGEGTRVISYSCTSGCDNLQGLARVAGLKQMKIDVISNPEAKQMQISVAAETDASFLSGNGVGWVFAEDISALVDFDRLRVIEVQLRGKPLAVDMKPIKDKWCVIIRGAWDGPDEDARKEESEKPQEIFPIIMGKYADGLAPCSKTIHIFYAWLEWSERPLYVQMVSEDDDGLYVRQVAGLVARQVFRQE